MSILKTIMFHHPELKKLYSSEQFKRSEEIIKLKLLLSLEQKEAAKILNMRFSDYLSFEKGSLDYSVESYDKAIKKLKNLIKK